VERGLSFSFLFSGNAFFLTAGKQKVPPALPPFLSLPPPPPTELWTSTLAANLCEPARRLVGENRLGTSPGEAAAHSPSFPPSSPFSGSENEDGGNPVCRFNYLVHDNRQSASPPIPPHVDLCDRKRFPRDLLPPPPSFFPSFPASLRKKRPSRASFAV